MLFLSEIIKLLNSRLVLVDFRMEGLKKEVECKCIVEFTIKFAYLLFPYLRLQKVTRDGLHPLRPAFHSRQPRLNLPPFSLEFLVVDIEFLELTFPR